MKRISRGTPYILTQGDIETALASLTPKTEAAIASLLGIGLDEWRGYDDRVKVRHMIDYQNSGTVATTFAALAKAHTDLEEAAFAVTQQAEADHLAEEVKALREMVHELRDRTVGKKAKA